MESLFQNSVFEKTIDRINLLTPSTQSLWGTMGVAQMFAHLTEAFTVPLQTKPHKRVLLGYIFGPLLKKKAYDNSPIGKNLKTVPSFVITDIKVFETEKENLVQHIANFYAKKEQGIGTVTHPFFGKLTGEQWGKGMYKHVNHHLKQFGV